MARSKDSDAKAFCDDLYTELSGMRLRIETIAEETALKYGEDDPLRSYVRHLTEISDMIDWKLQILAHSCPYDWKGSVEKVEATVSVPDAGKTGDRDFSGGYLGG